MTQNPAFASRHRFRASISFIVLISLLWLLFGPGRLFGNAEIALGASDPVIAVAGDIACDPASLICW
jgi:hypothetical protein